MLDKSSIAAVPVDAKDRTFYERLGRRIAEQRKAQGLTQVDMAHILGVAQQTYAHYEGGRARIAVADLRRVAETLGASVEDLIGTAAKPGKRGPTPKLQQQLERLSRLPRTKQRFVVEMLDTVLKQAS